MNNIYCSLGPFQASTVFFSETFTLHFHEHVVLPAVSTP